MRASGLRGGGLVTRPFGVSRVLYLWVDDTYVKCCRDRKVASTTVVAAIGCDEGGWRRVLDLGVVGIESYDLWLAFFREAMARGVAGVRLVVSDAHGASVCDRGVFQGATW